MNQKYDFDDLVDISNKWLDEMNRPENTFPSFKKYWDYFWKGFLGMPLKYSPMIRQHPVYSLEDLSCEQKDLVLMASDWKKVSEKLDKILLDGCLTSEYSLDKIRMEKEYVQKIYVDLKNSFYSSK